MPDTPTIRDLLDRLIAMRKVGVRSEVTFRFERDDYISIRCRTLTGKTEFSELPEMMIRVSPEAIEDGIEHLVDEALMRPIEDVRTRVGAPEKASWYEERNLKTPEKTEEQRLGPLDLDKFSASKTAAPPEWPED